MPQKRLTPKLETLLERFARFQIETKETDLSLGLDGLSLTVSYDRFIQTITDKFSEIPIRPHFVAQHPQYLSKNAEKLVTAIEFGYWEVCYSDAPSYPHPLSFMVQTNQLSSHNRKGQFYPPNLNAVFRAYHDYYGHYAYKLGFDTLSELKVAYAHEKDFHPLALDALLSETALQTAVYHVTGDYAEQKTIKLTTEITESWQEIKTLLV